MPQFNLFDDLTTDNGSAPIAMPIDSDEAGDPNAYRLSIEQSPEGVKSLAIQLPFTIHLKAMFDGLLLADSLNTLRLETSFFSGLALSIGQESSWFRQWIRAGRIPSAVIYEGIQPSSEINLPELQTTGVQVRSGQIIGETLIGVVDNNQLKLRIEYGDSRSEAPRFMHPSEFFSLLFWRQDCDRLFNWITEASNTAQAYNHPLLQQLGKCLDDSSEGYEYSENWLGLKPPLRIYKRIEWEARQTHIYHHDAWQRTAPRGSMVGVIRNPLAFEQYGAVMKCNVFLGDMAFRAGFRTTLPMSRDLTITPHSLQYVGVPQLVTGFSPSGGFARLSNGSRVTWLGTEYTRSLPFGEIRSVTTDDQDRIRREIEQEGRVLYYGRTAFCLAFAPGTSPSRVAFPGGQGARCPGPPPSSTPDDQRDSATYEYKIGHVFIISRFTGVGANGLTTGSAGLDQHCEVPTQMPNSRLVGLGWSGSLDENNRVFIELLPGGDPTESWGVVNLNCLTEGGTP